MMFYLTVPFLYKKIRSIRAATIFTCSTLLLSLLLSKLGSVVIPISDRELWRNFLYLALPSQMPVFGLGFILFFFSHHLDKLMPTLQNQKEALLLSRKFMSLLLLTFSILFCIFLTYGNLRIPVHFLYGIAFVILTMALQIYPWCLFVNPLTEYVGKISYSAYLTHFSILPLAKKIPEIVWLREDCNALPVYLLTFGITLGGTIIISSITYRLIEVPGQSLGRRLILIHN